jgi:hypothetical protein
MKQINQQQIDAILNVMHSYNVGVKDFTAVQDMFKRLPEVVEKAIELPSETKND